MARTLWKQAPTDLFLLTAHAQEESIETVGVGVSLYSHPAKRFAGPIFVFFLIRFEGLWSPLVSYNKKSSSIELMNSKNFFLAWLQG
jgi:hypothetical protein